MWVLTDTKHEHKQHIKPVTSTGCGRFLPPQHSINSFCMFTPKTRTNSGASLVEKAHAKMSISYKALISGLTEDVLTDFTGGITDHFNLGRLSFPSFLCSKIPTKLLCDLQNVVRKFTPPVEKVSGLFHFQHKLKMLLCLMFVVWQWNVLQCWVVQLISLMRATMKQNWQTVWKKIDHQLFFLSFSFFFVSCLFWVFFVWIVFGCRLWVTHMQSWDYQHLKQDRSLFVSTILWGKGEWNGNWWSDHSTLWNKVSLWWFFLFFLWLKTKQNMTSPD